MKKLTRKIFVAILITTVSFSLQACNDKGQIPDKKEDETLEVYDLKITDMHIRDPFIYVDQKTKSYYLHANGGKKFSVYTSLDLVNWKALGNSFVPSSDFWGQRDFWAPDVYEYNGKFYLFATFSGNTRKRGVSILIGDKPEGPFSPLVNTAVTPENWGCLDGSLYIDEKQEPWIIFCHEWLESIDGEIVAQQLTKDLTKPVGEPKVLFKATNALWVGAISAQGVTGYVTDAPFIYKLNNGELIMIWSSFTKNGRYAIGLARSKSGSLIGPWEHNKEPINSDDGGHAMLFTDLKGRLMISYHAPNSQTERPKIREVYINDGNLIFSF